MLSQQENTLHSTMVHTRTEYFGPEPGQAAGLVVEVIEMEGVYMVWVGVGESEAEAGLATTKGRLTGDWAYAMRSGGTRLYWGDSALGLAQRLGEVLLCGEVAVLTWSSDSTGGGGVCECGCSRVFDGSGRESDGSDVPGRELPKIGGIYRVARGVIIIN